MRNEKDTQRQFTIRLELPKASLIEERSAADLEGQCDIEDATPIEHTSGRGVSTAHFIEPVSVVAAITLAWLAKRLVDHWLKSKEQGVQIDLREVPPAVSRIAGVPTGFLLVINKDGSSKTIQAQYDKAEALMPVLESIFAAG